MAIRPQVADFVALGPLPAYKDATVQDLDRRLELLNKIAPPITAEEARSLVESFGPDDCFGLAWTLLHLIETAPDGWLDRRPDDDANEWKRRLWAAEHRDDLD